MCVFMVVTADEFELPLSVHDTTREVANALLIPMQKVHDFLYNKKNTGRYLGYKVVRVNIDDSEE